MKMYLFNSEYLQYNSGLRILPRFIAFHKITNIPSQIFIVKLVFGSTWDIENIFGTVQRPIDYHAGIYYAH
jgi:hypothetical protein